MTSERKRLANQQNALKSTGPRTAQGKARSCRNASKHGLCASADQLPPEDQALYQERLADWTQDAQPVDQVATYLLATAVLASVQLDRCARNEFAVIARRRRSAIAKWETAQDAEVARLAVLLAENPALACEQLESFAAGCDWLIEQWAELASAIARNGHWMPGQVTLAVQLLHDDARAREIQLNALVAAPEIELEAAEALLGLTAGDLDRDARQAAVEAVLPHPDAGRIALLEVISAEMKRLVAAGEQLWYGPDVADLSEQIDLATFDSSKKGALRHRYQTTHGLELHRTIRQFYQVQREAFEARRDGRTFVTPVSPPIQPPPVHTSPIPTAAPPPPVRNEPTEPPVTPEPAEASAQSTEARNAPEPVSCPLPPNPAPPISTAPGRVAAPHPPTFPPEGGASGP
jgi:hypothetical protein